MDIELKNFKQKLNAVSILTALTWICIFFYKTTKDLVKRKILKKQNEPFKVPNDFKDETLPEIQPILFLGTAVSLSNEKPAGLNFYTHKTFGWKVISEDEQHTHLLHRFRSFPFMTASHEGQKFDSVCINLLAILEDWKENNPPGALPGWHPYTLSERLIHWCWTLHFLSDRNDPGKDELRKALTKSILEQANFLYQNFECHLGHHNHLINNARALFTVSVLFPSYKKSQLWQAYAKTTFEKEWPYQALNDGVHAEQSTTYHFLLTRTLWEFKFLYKQAEFDFPFSEDLRKMIAYAATLTRPDATIPFIGHITPDWPWKELVGLLPVWGVKNQIRSALGSCYKMFPAEYEERNNQQVYNFSSSGQLIFKSPDIHAVLSADPRGVLKIHGDQNLLGIDLWFKGSHLILDPGLDSYNMDENRSWFESWQGQSTFVIDNMSPVVIDWRRRQLPGEYCNVTSANSGDEHGLQAKHTGFHRLPDPVTVTRKLKVESDNRITIIDSAKGKQTHTYQANFHFGEKEVRQVDNQTLEISDLKQHKVFRMMSNIEINAEIVKKDIAVSYGEKRAGNSCVITATFKGNFVIEYNIYEV